MRTTPEKYEVRKTPLKRCGLTVRPPGILTMNAWVANRRGDIDRRITKSLKVTRTGENNQETFKEVPSCRQHTESFLERDGT